jgi:hypothetical protein
MGLSGSWGRLHAPLSCQEQPAITDNREYSQGIHATAGPACAQFQGWWRQPDPKSEN